VFNLSNYEYFIGGEFCMKVNNQTRPLRVLTWHIHGSYLYYLVQANHQFLLPVKPGKPEGYGGRSGSFPWPDNVRDIPANQVKDEEFDCILFQSRRNYEVDQFEILSESQRKLPRLYLEHDPPRENPTDTRHVVDDPNVLLIHVTHFNNLMWDNGRTPTLVIEHGVMVPDGVRYTGELERGIVVVNGLAARGRRLGADIYEKISSQVPLDLVGMGSNDLGGVGEKAHTDLPFFVSRYRFFFNPIRYTSLGLAVCEAMMTGTPIVGLATTEMVTVVKDGESGYLDTDPDCLIQIMKELIENPGEAMRLGEGARKTALQRFNIERFKKDWDEAFRLVSENSLTHPTHPVIPALSQVGEKA
jgi:hypothetical protein